MKRGFFYTATPFLLLLLVVIIGVSLSDLLAERMSDEPTTIRISTVENIREQSVVWQFEDAESEGLESDFKNDSLYVSAVNAYKSRRLNRAEDEFVMLATKYPNRPELLNYLGLVKMQDLKMLEAKDFFLGALQVDEQYLPALINGGLVYSRLENYRVADSLYQLAIQIAPEASKPRLNKGIMHCRVGEWELAMNTLEPLLNSVTGDKRAKAESYYGMALFNRGDTIAAAEHFEKAIEFAPTMITPRIYLGLCAPTMEERSQELSKLTQLYPSYAPAYYYLGILAEQDGDKQKAKNLFEKALQLNPSDQDLSSVLGSFLIENDMMEQARNYFDLVYREDSISPQNYFFQAKMTIRETGDTDEAIRLYERAIALSGDNFAEAYLNMGILYRKQGDVTQALRCYEKASQLRDNYEEAWYNQALAYRSIGKNADAERCYRKALDINPNSTKAAYNLAILLNQSDRRAEARTHWEQVIDIDPNYAKAWYNLGLSYQKDRAFSEAISVYQQMLNRFPGYEKGWFNLARAQTEEGLTDEAVQSYEEAINADPTYVAAWKNLGNLLASEDNIDQAIARYTQAIDLDNADPELRYNLALQYEKRGEMQEAVIQLNKAVQLRPDYLKAIGKWIELSAQLQDPIQSIRARQAECALNPNKECQYDLARSFHKAGLREEAIAGYLKAEELGKKDVWAAYWRAKALQEMDNFEGSHETYLIALERNPEHKFTLYRLALHPKSGSRAEVYLDKLRSLYPDFVEEKGL